MSTDQQEVIDRTVAGLIPEAGGYDAAQMFQRAGTWEGTGGAGRLVKKLFGRGSEGEPREPERFNYLVIADGRMHLFGVKPSGGAWKGTGKIGDWALSDLRVRASDAHVDKPRDHAGMPTGSVDTIQLSIQIVPEGRTLKLEGTPWGDDTTVRETADALVAAAGG